MTMCSMGDIVARRGLLAILTHDHLDRSGGNGSETGEVIQGMGDEIKATKRYAPYQRHDRR